MQLTLEQAIAAGFCIISRHHRIAARLDRPDWREVMDQKYPRLIDSLEAAGTPAAHQYRGSFATGRIDVPEEWLDVLPDSKHGPNEYRPMHSRPAPPPSMPPAQPVVSDSLPCVSAMQAGAAA